MTPAEREALVERMAEASWRAMLRYVCHRSPRLAWHELAPEHREVFLCEARAALAVAEPVVREECARVCEAWANEVEARAPASPTIIQARNHAAAIRRGSPIATPPEDAR